MRLPARFVQPIPDSYTADKRDANMRMKNEHIAAVLTVFALATVLQWRAAAAADEPISAGRWTASSPEVERNIRNFIQFQKDGVAGTMGNIDKYMAPEFVVETSGDEALQRLLGNTVPGRIVVHRDDLKKRGPSKDFAGVEAQKRTMEEIYGVGDEVVAKWHIQAVVKDKLFGLQGKGQTIDIVEVGFVRFDKEGRMTQGWFRIDSAGLLRQLNYTVQAPQ
jgi:predicted ester cyclase